MGDPAQFERLLSARPFFGRLESDTRRAVAALCVTHSLARGETLFLKDDPADAFYAIRRGEIRITAGTGAGRRMTLNILGPGDIFGEIALFDGRPRSADAVAAEPAELFAVRRRNMLDLVGQHADLSMRVIELLCERLRFASARLEEAVLMPLPARIARRLLGLAEDFGSEIHISQDDIADFAGTTRETVNRQLQSWRRQGMLDLHRNRVVVRDPAALALAALSF
ncbi:cAMP-binding domain of CRP or a regulatory subunit of cAMP-dependent protein kinases [Methylobacterium sp. 275MFSha3.1]|uniref:Crp/Fnr family transcriptional regulator n=1 Tax=Methylobacterium sp. 275MFSha3.1 TaxID=1502746 RepID=UPI0008A8058A|nr:Crp/Fnr family transcriptional regulator [Methylobacterium sp. 275MFSha3.1]SEI16081.1 cAMP-binding domain of CRP or a regulatory subunit of cAMP-dependent protein kinases [Methylobacterium sp. 275MFSha3.1]